MQAFQYLAKLKGEPITVEVKSPGTRYYADAKTLGKDYWASNVELIARAFAAYIQDL